MTTVTVPGVGDLEFPDGMSQADMAAAIQRNFPQIHQQRDPAEGGVPNLAALEAEAAKQRPAPTLGEKLRGGIEAGMNMMREAVAFVPSMAGAAAGFAGALMHNVNVATTPGAKPDQFEDPGANAEASAGAVHTAMTQPAPGMPQGQDSPLGQDYTQKAGDALGPAMMTMGVHGAELAPPIESTRAAARGAQAAGAAVREAPARVAAAGVRKGLGTPDPELVKIAQLADQFPNKMTIPPDRLVPGGAGKSIAESVSNAPGSGGRAIESANKNAFTKNTIHQIDPESTADRLTPKTFDDAMKRNGEQIGAAYDQAGPLPVADVQSAMADVLHNATKNGAGDVPRLVASRFSELLGKADTEGNIPPEALRQWDSDLGRQARTSSDDEAAGHISDLQSAVRDAVESRLDGSQAAALRDARRRYAYGMLLESSVAKAGQGTDPIVGLDGLVQPGKLINALNSTRAGRSFNARDNGGPITDLARVGQLMDSTTPALKRERSVSADLAVELLHAGTTLIGARTAAGRAYNAVGERVTKGMVPPATKEAPAAPPAPPKPLLLGYQPPAAPAVPVTPEGQAVLPEQAQAREDFQTSQRVAGGTGVPVSPEAAIQAPALETRLGAANYPATPPAAPAPGPLGDLTPAWETSLGAGGAPAPEGLSPMLGAETPTPAAHGTPPTRAGREIPAAPGRPDLPDTMVSGPGGQTATEPTPASPNVSEPTHGMGRAMQTDDAALARHGQTVEGPPKAPEGYEPSAPPPPPEPPKHPPNPAEQSRLDEIAKAKAATSSPIVLDALNKAETQVLKDVKTRHTLEEAKAAAKELRAHAQTMTDATVKQSLLDRAEKLDPQPQGESNAKPPATYPRLIEARKGAGRGKASQAAPGGKADVQGAGQGDAAAKPAGQSSQAGEDAGQGVGNAGPHEDAVIDEVDKARFDTAHPRGPNGRFAPRK